MAEHEPEPQTKTVIVVDYQPPATHPSPRHEELADQLHKLGLKRQLAVMEKDTTAVAAIDAEMAPLYAEYDVKPDEPTTV